MPIGSYSTHRIFPTKKLVKVPMKIELENVVTLMTKGFTFLSSSQNLSCKIW